MCTGKKLRILYHHRTMGRGAEGLHILHIAEALEAMGHQVDILSPPGIDPRREAGTGPLDMTEVKTRGILTFWKNISRKAPQVIFECIEFCYNFWALPRLILAHRRSHYDLIYERHAMFLLAGTLFSCLTGIPLFVEVNEISGPKRARRQTFRRLAGWVERFVFHRAAGIFAVSSFLADKIAGKIGIRGSITVASNAIHPKDFQRVFYGERIRTENGLIGKVIFGFAGWFSEWDRLDFLVETFGQLCDQTGRSDLILMLVGDGTVIPSVREQINHLGLEKLVLLTGPIARREILDYLDAIDIAVIPHSNDYGSPMVMFEFMALGKPVVAPALMPILDVIENGKNGLIFPLLSFTVIIQILKELLDNDGKRKQIGAAARERVIRSHTWEANARLIINRFKVIRSGWEG